MAVFGMESSCIGAPDDAHHCGSVCIGHASPEIRASLGVFHAIHNGDLIFIKAFTPQTGLDMKAIGIVLSSFPVEHDGSMCIPVEWLWTGDKHITDPDDHWPFRGNAIYEEHDLVVQREILDLLPAGLAPQLP